VDLELHVLQHDDKLRHRRSEHHFVRATRPSVQRDGSANYAELVGTRHRRRPGCVRHRIELPLGCQCERADHSSLQRVANRVSCPLHYAVRWCLDKRSSAFSIHRCHRATIHSGQVGVVTYGPAVR
jgi:hypothetical protein